MFLEIQLLGAGQDFTRSCPRNNNYAITVGCDDVAGMHVYAVARNRDIGPVEFVVMNRCRRNCPECKNWKSDSAKLREVAHSTIDYGSGVATRCHGGSHQASHAPAAHPLFHHPPPSRLGR